MTISDNKQVTSELKRSLEGRLPQPEQPVTLEIQMETLEVVLISLSTVSFTRQPLLSVKSERGSGEPCSLGIEGKGWPTYGGREESGLWAKGRGQGRGEKRVK